MFSTTSVGEIILINSDGFIVWHSIIIACGDFPKL